MVLDSLVFGDQKFETVFFNLVQRFTVGPSVPDALAGSFDVGPKSWCRDCLDVSLSNRMRIGDFGPEV